MNSTHCTDGNAEAQRRDTVCPRSCVCELGSEFWKFDCRVQCSRLCHGCYSVCAQSCPTLCDPSSPPGSSVHGVSQARILEWVALASSGGSSRLRNQIASLVSPALTGGFLAWGPVGVGRASHQLKGLSGGSEKLTLLGSKCEPRAGFPELEMEVGGRVSGREDCRSEGQLVGVTWVTWKECTCDWEGTGFG